MPIVAGLDEAGYGPPLGPLVVTATVFLTRDHVKDLWETLAAVVSRGAPTSEHHLSVADSKKVYSRAKGLTRLEETVLAFAHAYSPPCTGPRDMIESCAPAASAGAAQCPWYDDGHPAHPLDALPDRVAALAHELTSALADCGVELLLVRPQVVFAPEFNQSLRKLRSKAAVSFAQCVTLLREVFDLGHDTQTTVFVDKQGGRNRYGYLLLRAFPKCDIRILAEGRAESSYRITGDQGEMTVTFAQGCEDKQMPVALASMFSKYVRELYMMRFNRFWTQHVPDLRATAGYPQDAKRFLRDIEPARIRLGIEWDQLVRLR